MKKRLIALMLVLILVIPAGMASAASWYRVNTNFLEVHSMPGTNSQILGRYRRDYALKINKSYSDGWSDVTFSNGFNGYVLTKYLKKASSYTAWVYGDNTALPVTLTLRLRLHAAPAQGTEALDTLRDRVMATLLCSRDPLLSVTGCEALAYQPQNGRLVAELHLSLDGLLRTTDEEV